MKTIAQQIGIKKFPFIIKDDSGNVRYLENSDGYWWGREYDKKGRCIKYWNSRGLDENFEQQLRLKDLKEKHRSYVEDCASILVHYSDEILLRILETVDRGSKVLYEQNITVKSVEVDWDGVTVVLTPKEGMSITELMSEWNKFLQLNPTIVLR